MVSPLSWIEVAPDAPYFVDDRGRDWTPIGQNDAISWPELAPLFRRRDLPAVERHLTWLVAHGVTCLRLMVEYAQERHRYLERPVGVPVPAIVRLWDDLFAMCERLGLRILLTPVDTFWMWLHWHRHPWSAQQGGPAQRPSELLTNPGIRQAVKDRLAFMVRRWGGSGALFAWDLWNEIHHAQAGDSADCFPEFIGDLSAHVRSLELELYGRSHPQTVSLFGPELRWQPQLPLAEPIFRHPDLDFASIHIYSSGTIDDPRDTIAPAVAMRRIVRESLGEIRDGRPFLDSEHGPIHAFKDRHRTLPEAFDDEYFRHMSWAHLASGGVGGGMRWPNRRPHTLTAGMRRAQRAMADFLPLIAWQRFRREPLMIKVRGFHVFACGDSQQALVWLLRRQDALGEDGRIDPAAPPRPATVKVSGVADGRFSVVGWDTAEGCPVEHAECVAEGGALTFTSTPIAGDRAFAVCRI